MIERVASFMGGRVTVELDRDELTGAIASVRIEQRDQRTAGRVRVWVSDASGRRKPSLPPQALERIEHTGIGERVAPFPLVMEEGDILHATWRPAVPVRGSLGVVQVASATSLTSGVATIQLAWDSTPIEGNLLDVTSASHQTTGTPITFPSGWTVTEEANTGALAHPFTRQRRVAGASEPDTVTTAWTTTRRSNIVGIEFDNQAAGDSLDGSAQQFNNNADAAFPSPTAPPTSGANRHAIAHWNWQYGMDGFTFSDGFTDLFSGSGHDRARIAYAGKLFASAGAEPSCTATGTSGTPENGYSSIATYEVAAEDAPAGVSERLSRGCRLMRLPARF